MNNFLISNVSFNAWQILFEELWSIFFSYIKYFRLFMSIYISLGYDKVYLQIIGLHYRKANSKTSLFQCTSNNKKENLKTLTLKSNSFEDVCFVENFVISPYDGKCLKLPIIILANHNECYFSTLLTSGELISWRWYGQISVPSLFSLFFNFDSAP